jgi:SecD/SecF fusion protein
LRPLYRNILLVFVAIIALVIPLNFVPDFTSKKPIRKGLDLSGGTRAVLQMLKKADTPELTRDNQQKVVAVIESRVNSLGVTEPVVQSKGSDQIVVEMPATPGKSAEERRKDLLDLINPAKLEFIYLKDVKTVGPEPAGKVGARYIYESPDRIKDTDTGRYLTDAEIKSQILYKDPANIIVTGSDLRAGGARVDIGSGRAGRGPVTTLEFNDKGTKKFADFTTDHINDLLAIVLNGKIDSAPRINSAITDGRAIIEGGARDVREAQKLANLLNAGALPVPLEVVQVYDVEATLGQNAMDFAVKGGIIGIVAVMLFMLAYYSLPGLVACAALIVYAGITISLFRLIPVVITLPGFAGFVLSVGMAVDANILIFERMKEELRAGRTLHAAVDAGFDRAWTSIRDSNVSSLITCLILYSFGTGPVKGFAFVLALGILVSIATAVYFSRALLHGIVNQPWAQNPRWYRVGFGVSAHETNIQVIKRTPLWFTISAAIMVVGLAFMGVNKSRTGSFFKLGIDFTGGTYITYLLPQGVSATDADVRAVFAAQGVDEISVQRTKTADAQGRMQNIVTVRTNVLDQKKQSEIAPAIEKGMQAKFGEATRQLEFSGVGPTISKELTQKAVSAIILACLAIMIYLGIVFGQYGFADGLRYGFSAVVALVHDVIVILGFMGLVGYVLNWEMDTLFVTAALTVIGFSVHDTIVVFDRIRENAKLHGREWTFQHICDASVTQTLSRSINTSMTVVIVLVALLVFGSHGSLALRVFTSVLLVGVISGTYSSIFNATPVLYLLERGEDRKRVQTGPAKKTEWVDTTKPIVSTPKAAQPAQSAPESETTAAPKPKAPGAAKKSKRRF